MKTLDDIAAGGHDIDYWEDADGDRFTNHDLINQRVTVEHCMGKCKKCGWYFEITVGAKQWIFDDWGKIYISPPDFGNWDEYKLETCKDLTIREIIE